MEDEWLIREEVAEELRTSPQTLAQWAYRGVGPSYVRVGRRALYRRRDLEEWLESRMKVMA